jgi:hypothetical protein
MTRPPVDRTSFAARLANLHHDIALIEAAMSEMALAADGNPDDAAVREQLAQYKRERAEKLETIENLELAQTAAARQSVEVDTKATERRLGELRKRHDAATAKAMSKAIDLCDYITAAGPQWTSALAALDEANAITREMIRLAGGPAAQQRYYGHGAMTSGHDPLASAVGSAICSTGIGTVGPATMGVIVNAPARGHEFTVADLERNLNALFERQRAAGAKLTGKD